MVQSFLYICAHVDVMQTFVSFVDDFAQPCGGREVLKGESYLCMQLRQENCLCIIALLFVFIIINNSQLLLMKIFFAICDT